MNFATFVEDAVHRPTQTKSTGFDLTVANVYDVRTAGRVDFGGSELETADLAGHASEKRNPDDNYAWWHLAAGKYAIEYNETLDVSADTVVTVQTRDELLARGAFHPTITTRTLDPLPLSVAGDGLRLRENARVSTIVDAAQPPLGSG